MTKRRLWYLALPALIVVACVVNPAPAVAQMTSVGIDCSQIAALHLLQQENMRAGLALMECGVIPRPNGAATATQVDNDAPLAAQCSGEQPYLHLRQQLHQE